MKFGINARPCAIVVMSVAVIVYYSVLTAVAYYRPSLHVK